MQCRAVSYNHVSAAVRTASTGTKFGSNQPSTAGAKVPGPFSHFAASDWLALPLVSTRHRLAGSLRIWVRSAAPERAGDGMRSDL